MFEKLNYIELSGERFPIKCDILVLEQIQEKYGDLSAFEKRIYNFIPTVDENGNAKKNNEGLIIGTVEYPDIKAVKDALLWMVNEGLDIEGKDEMGAKELFRKIDASPIDVGAALHEEYIRCFERKNVTATQKK